MGIAFITKYIPTINILNSKIHVKDKYTRMKNTALKFFQRLNKLPAFFAKFYHIYNQQRKYLKPLSGNDIISLHVNNNSSYQITLPLGHCETNATTLRTNEVANRVYNILQLLDICQSTILDEELSINNVINNEKRNTDYFTKTLFFKSTFEISHYTLEQQNFLTMFDFQHSQITQEEFKKLAKLLLKKPTVYTTSKIDVGKINSPLNLPLKPDAVFKKQRASKVPNNYMIK